MDLWTITGYFTFTTPFDWSTADNIGVFYVAAETEAEALSCAKEIISGWAADLLDVNDDCQLTLNLTATRSMAP